MSAEPPATRLRGARYDEDEWVSGWNPPIRCQYRLESLLRVHVRVNVPKVVSTHRPRSKPKLGQHFLNSEEADARIVDALGDVSQSTVLEIGPGQGMLTSLLAKRARRL